MEMLWEKFARGAPLGELSSALEQLSDEKDFEELGERIITLEDRLRLHALEAVENVSNPEVLGILAALYEDPVDEIRERAMMALYFLGGDTLAEEIVSGVLLEDPVPAVRMAAAMALGVSRSPNARALLTEALQDEDLGVRTRVEQQLKLLR